MIYAKIIIHLLFNICIFFFFVKKNDVLDYKFVVYL